MNQEAEVAAADDGGNETDSEQEYPEVGAEGPVAIEQQPVGASAQYYSMISARVTPRGTTRGLLQR